MKKYQGPAYKAKDYKPVESRRFNRQFEQHEWSKPVKEQLNSQDQTYQLPPRTLDLRTLESLSAPVNEQMMERHIEIKQTQDREARRQNRYQVAYKEAPRVWQEDKVKTQPSQQENTNLPSSSSAQGVMYGENSKSGYQPAYQPGVIATNQTDSVSPSSDSYRQHRNQIEALDKLAWANAQARQQAVEHDDRMDAMQVDGADSESSFSDIVAGKARFGKGDQQEVEQLAGFLDVKRNPINHVTVQEKSVETRQIRDLALRMVKRPESYLLFDESK